MNKIMISRSQKESFSSSGVLQRKCACGLNTRRSTRCDTGSCSNAKKTPNVGSVDSKFEREADFVAAKVVGMGTPPQSRNYNTAGFAETIMSSGNAGRGLSYSGGKSLSSDSRKYMEPRFGVDFGKVKIHQDSTAQRTANSINARAFSYGSHIWLGKGASERDRGLMAHELTHVVQQSSAKTDGVLNGGGGDLYINVDGKNNLVTEKSQNLQIQRQTYPMPTDISVVANHQIPIAASHVASGWRSGFGGVSEILVENNDPDLTMSIDYNGAQIKETFKSGSGDNASIGGCSNASGQGGAGGSTFTVGTGVSFSQNGLNISFPAKANTFYDMHVKGFPTNILPTGIDSQKSICNQEYTYDGNVVGNSEYERLHNIIRTSVGGQDVATIDLVKFGRSLATP